MHTPGPWAWQKFGNEYCLTGQHSMRPIVLTAQSNPGMGYCERCQGEADVIGGSAHLTSRNAEKDLLIPLDPEHPDARLIAAAPELLEALDHLHRYLLDQESYWNSPMMKQVDELIRKARGSEIHVRRLWVIGLSDQPDLYLTKNGNWSDLKLAALFTDEGRDKGLPDGLRAGAEWVEVLETPHGLKTVIGD